MSKGSYRVKRCRPIRYDYLRPKTWRDRISKSKTIHGMTGSKVYQTWSGIRRRCTDKKSGSWKDYGGRGIKVCKRWQKFENFYADMGHPPTKKHTIERINNKGDYKPSNCKWATRKEQNQNYSRNKILKIKGQFFSVKEASKKFKIPYSRIIGRLSRGWTDKRAVSHV